MAQNRYDSEPFFMHLFSTNLMPSDVKLLQATINYYVRKPLLISMVDMHDIN